ncbi:MAG: hypothetical protein QW355_05255 [Sulfolobales archaeon]
MISAWALIILAAFVGYFIIGIIAGYIAKLRTGRGLYEFYIAGGTLSALLVGVGYMSAYMEAWEFVGMPAVIASEGFEWWLIEMIFYLSYVALFYMVGLRLFRIGKIHKTITPVDFIVFRAGGFERILRLVLGILITYATIVYVGMIYIPAAGVITAMSYGELSYHLLLVLYTVFMVIYIILGGMRAVAYNDLIAGATFIVAFIAMIYAVNIHWGGFGDLAWKAFSSAPERFERTLPIQYFLTMLFFYGISWLFIPHLIVRFFAAKDYKGVILGGMGAITGFFLGAFLSPLFLGLSILAQYGTNLPEVTVVEEYPAMMFLSWFGTSPLIILIILGLVAIARSTIDALLLLTSSIIDRDILERTLRIKVSERTREIITRVIVTIIGILGIIVALNPEAPMVIIGYELAWPAYAVVAFPALLILFWRRANKYGILTGYLVGLSSLILFTYVIWPEPPHNPFGVWEGTLPSVLALATTVVVSLLTPPPPREHVEWFYGDKLR